MLLMQFHSAYVNAQETHLLLQLRSFGGVPMRPNPARYLVKQNQGVVFPLLTATSLLAKTMPRLE